MLLPRTTCTTRVATFATILSLSGVLTLAQEQDNQTQDEEEIEEIVVIHFRDGDPRDLEARSEELMRLRIQREIEIQRILEEEFEWRSSETTKVAQPSRISWGYDPEAANRMRMSNLSNPQWEGTRPASLFRVSF